MQKIAEIAHECSDTNFKLFVTTILRDEPITRVKTMKKVYDGVPVTTRHFKTIEQLRIGLSELEARAREKMVESVLRDGFYKSQSIERYDLRTIAVTAHQCSATTFKSFIDAALRNASEGQLEKILDAYSGMPGVVMNFSGLREKFQTRITDLQSLVREKLVTAALRSGLQRQTDRDLTKIALAAYECSTVTFKTFISAALQYPSQAQLRTIILAFSRKSGATNHPEVLKLFRKRSSYLTKLSKDGVPKFSWSQPHAHFTGKYASVINAFLRGEEQTMHLGEFTGIGQARGWVANNFGHASSQSENRYSARAIASGRGNGSFVVITKTKGEYERMKCEYFMKIKELTSMSFVLDANNAATSETGIGGNAGNNSIVTPCKRPGEESGQETNEAIKRGRSGTSQVFDLTETNDTKRPAQVGKFRTVFDLTESDEEENKPAAA